jgi:hypothetical protein
MQAYDTLILTFVSPCEFTLLIYASTKKVILPLVVLRPSRNKRQDQSYFQHSHPEQKAGIGNFKEPA